MLANVGDCRAVLGTTQDDGSLVAVQLTVDFKPNLPRKHLSLFIFYVKQQHTFIDFLIVTSYFLFFPLQHFTLKIFQLIAIPSKHKRNFHCYNWVDFSKTNTFIRRKKMYNGDFLSTLT